MKCARPGCPNRLTLAQLARGGAYCSLACGRRCRADAASTRAACAQVGVSRPTWRKAVREGRAGWRYGRAWYQRGKPGPRKGEG